MTYHDMCYLCLFSISVINPFGRRIIIKAVSVKADFNAEAKLLKYFVTKPLCLLYTGA